MKRSIFLLIGLIFFAQISFADDDGRRIVTTAATSVAMSTSDIPFHELTVCAEKDNTGVIAYGTSPIALLATREGIPLDAGDCYTDKYDSFSIKAGNMNSVRIDSTVNGDGVTFYVKN